MRPSSTAGTLIKGASIKARLAFVEKQHGADVLSTVLAGLNAQDRSVLQGRVLPSTLFPLELNARLDESIAQVLDPDDPVRIFRRLGKASAEANLSSFHRIFLRGQGPHDVLKDFPSIRHTYYSDGEATYTPTGETSGTFRVVSAGSHTVPDCESTAGYFEKAIEMMGGKDVSVALGMCRHYGDPHCELICRWR